MNSMVTYRIFTAILKFCKFSLFNIIILKLFSFWKKNYDAGKENSVYTILNYPKIINEKFYLIHSFIVEFNRFFILISFFTALFSLI